MDALNENKKMQCKGVFSKEECLTALKTVEYYKFFWSDLGTDMTASFNYAFQKGSLSVNQKRGIISLIPKKNKDKTLLENRRPISLLNIDYKLLTKSISKRLVSYS